jgi:GT2 family glycosyltransferase
MDLSLIYVNWNSVDYLRESIASVYTHTDRISFEIIVVDNASPEGRIEELQEEFPSILLIRSKANLGFAGANNLGFRHSSGRHVLFLNPDTTLIGPAITVMLTRIRNVPDAGIVGCKLLNTDRSVQLTAIQTFPTILNQILDLEYLQLRWPACPLWNLAPLFAMGVRLLKVEVISGACMLLRREVFDQVKMFSEDYFMYAEDIDLNYKVSRAGFSNYYVGDAEIIHHGGRSSSQQAGSHWATVMKYQAMRKLFRKTRGRLYGSVYRAAIGCAALVRLLLLVLALPLGNILWERHTLRRAARKWQCILQWAIGWPKLA